MEEYKKSPDQPIKLWSFCIREIFERHDAYVERLTDVEDILLISVDFMKLDKIDFGGGRGRNLLQNHLDLMNEFHVVYNSCTNANVSALEPTNDSFGCMKTEFHRRIKVLERKLAQILRNAFEDCSNCVESNIKLIEMVGWLALRPFIRLELSFHLRKFLRHFNEELDSIEKHLDERLEHQVKVRL